MFYLRALCICYFQPFHCQEFPVWFSLFGKVLAVKSCHKHAIPSMRLVKGILAFQQFVRKLYRQHLPLLR